jgi:prepilin-type N-terminal cleavage/methylation domain-containing protein
MIPKLTLKRIKSRAGFSLIEILVAMGIFSFAILGLAVGAVTITRSNATSQYHTGGTNAAQDIIEQLKSRSYANVNNGNDTVTIQGIPYLRTWVVAENANATLKQVTVTVQWTDYAARTLTVSSAVSQ